MSLSVWWVEFIGADRTHKAIFLETKDDERGTLYSVEGNILRGMEYRSKPFRQPEKSASFVSKEKLGTIAPGNIQKIDEVCRTFPPPAPQMNISGRPINPAVPLYRCTEWTTDVRNALFSRGIIQWDTRLDTDLQKYYQYKFTTAETTWITEQYDQDGQLIYLDAYNGTTSQQKPAGLYRPANE